MSPDGRRAALSILEAQGRHLWIQDLERGGLRKLTFDGSENSQPAWTPDGDEVVYRHVGRERALYQVPADGSAPPRPVRVRSSSLPSLSNPSVSPDGQWVVFNEGGGFRVGMFAIAATGDTTERSLGTVPNGAMVDGEVSPDGRWLAYVSDETGTPQVYVQPFLEVDGAKVLVSRASGVQPHWSSDQSEIFYFTLEGDLMVADVVPGETFSTAPPTRLFNRGDQPQGSGLDFGVHPDGQRFLLSVYTDEGDAEAGAGTEPQLVVVDNFFRVLRERAGG